MALPFEETSAELLDNLKSIASLNQSSSYFNKEWALNIEEKLDQTFEDVFKELADERMKMLREKKKCIIFGRTSAGKSSFINAILDSPVLHTGNGTTTTGYVTIKKSSTEESYLDIENERKETTFLKKWNNSHTPSIYHADLFYEKSKWPVGFEDFEIIDTPGINEETTTDDNVNRYCKDGHFIILVVDSAGGLDMTVKTYVSKIQRTYLQLHIFIVFNKWDKIKDDDKKENVTTRHITSAKEVLCTNLGYSEEEANKRIFFLSSKQQINHQDGHSGTLFASFLKEFEKEISNKSRKIALLKEIHEKVSEKLEPLREMMGKMKSQRESFKRTSEEKIKKVENVREELLRTIKQMCKQNSGELKNKLLEVINMKMLNVKMTKEDETRIKNSMKTALSRYETTYASICKDIYSFFTRNPRNDNANGNDVNNENGPNDQFDFDFILPYVNDITFQKISSSIGSSENTTGPLSIDERKNLLLSWVQKLLTNTIDDTAKKLKTRFDELVKIQGDKYMIDKLGVVEFDYRPQDNEQNTSFASTLLENILIIKADKLDTKSMILKGIITAWSMSLFVSPGIKGGVFLARIGIGAVFGKVYYAALAAIATKKGINIGDDELFDLKWSQIVEDSQPKVNDKWANFEKTLCEQFNEVIDNLNKNLETILEDLEGKINSIQMYLDEKSNEINDQIRMSK